MGFLENLGKKVADAGQKTVQKTKEMSEILRLESLVSKEESKIDQTHARIGARYMELHAEDAEDAFADLVNEIKTARLNIESYRQQIADVKNAGSAEAQPEEDPTAKKCPNCGAPVLEGRRFCGACGSPIPQEEAAAEAEAGGETRFCASCGAQIPADSAFCEKCGAKVDPE